MWGVNGQTYHWPMGNYRHIALVFLQALAFSALADFTVSDSEKLSQINSYTYGILENWDDFHTTKWFQFRTVQDEMNSKLSHLQTMNSLLNEISNGMPDLSNIQSDIHTIKYAISEGLSNSDIHRQGNLVQNVRAIRDYLALMATNSFGNVSITNIVIAGGVSNYFPNISGQFLFGRRDDVLQGGVSSAVFIWEELLDAIQDHDYVRASDLYEQYVKNYGDLWWNYFQTFGVLSTNEFVGSRNDLLWLNQYMYSMGQYSDVNRGFFNAYSKNYYNQYATLPSYKLLSNMVYAVSSGSLIDKALHDGTQYTNLLADSSTGGIFDGISGLVSGRVGFASSDFVSTNSYADLSEYADSSNWDNGIYDNSSYSGFYDDYMKTNSLYSRIVNFNFKTKLEDKLGEFIDNIDVGESELFSIDFGEIPLVGGYIGSVSIQRNEDYLEMVDWFIMGLEVLAGFWFSFSLWSEIRDAAK